MVEIVGGWEGGAAAVCSWFLLQLFSRCAASLAGPVLFLPPVKTNACPCTLLPPYPAGPVWIHCPARRCRSACTPRKRSQWPGGRCSRRRSGERRKSSSTVMTATTSGTGRSGAGGAGGGAGAAAPPHPRAPAPRRRRLMSVSPPRRRSRRRGSRRWRSCARSCARRGVRSTRAQGTRSHSAVRCGAPRSAWSRRCHAPHRPRLPEGH